MTITLTFWGCYAAVLALFLILALLFGGQERLGAWGYPDSTPLAAASWIGLAAWIFVGLVSAAARGLP